MTVVANGYCTPADVFKVLQIIDEVTGVALTPSATTFPTEDDIQEQINIFSAYIDSSTHDTWLIKSHKGIYDRGTEWVRNNSGAYYDVPYRSGGWCTQLLSPVIPIDTAQGDKVEIMTSTPGVYVDITSQTSMYWIDYDAGVFHYLGSETRIQNLFRITYRYGRNTTAPLDIQSAVAKLTAKWVMQTDWYRTKIGGGGDIQSKAETIRDWDKFIDKAIVNNMNAGDVISLLP